MSNWKARAPKELAMPSSMDAVEHFKHGTRSLPVVSPFSSSGVQQFPILTPGSLLSPVDPGFLEGPSSMARFGLDIGGTLCKVVYFEPAEEFVQDLSRTSKMKKPNTDNSGDGFKNGKVGRENQVPTVKSSSGSGNKSDTNGDHVTRGICSADSSNKCCDAVNGCAVDGPDRKGSRLRVKEDNAAELLHSGLAALAPTIISTTGDSPRSSECHKAVYVDEDSNHIQGVNHRVGGNGTDADTESGQCSCGTPGARVDHPREDTRNPRRAASSEDDLNSRRRAKKIWVSSHEPIHLPGRGTLYFKCFETWRMEEFLNLTKKYHLVTEGRAIGATGGGARKFGDQFLEIAGLQLQRADELKSLVRGIDFLARHAQEESFEYHTGSYQGGTIQRPWESPENSSDDGSEFSSEEDFSLILSTEEPESVISSPATVSLAATSAVGSQEEHTRTEGEKFPTLKGPMLAKIDSGIWMGSNESLHPYLVVNIGSGVSILRVNSAETFERVGGTSLGGSTFLGLAAALTGCQSFEEAMSLAIQGDSTHVDMLVGDIYGGDYTEMGLAATTVASSFGKLVLPRAHAEAQKPQDLAKAALLMVTNNIGSIAWLHARAAGVRSIMFTGSFLYNNKLAMRLLAVAMEFWSKGNMKAVFLRHEGHAGAMGALLSLLESSNPLDALLLD